MEFPTVPRQVDSVDVHRTDTGQQRPDAAELRIGRRAGLGRIDGGEPVDVIRTESGPGRHRQRRLHRNVRNDTGEAHPAIGDGELKGGGGARRICAAAGPDVESGRVDVANPDARTDDLVGLRPRRRIRQCSEQMGVASPHADLDAVHPGGAEGANRLSLQAVLDVVADRDERPHRKKRDPDRTEEEWDAAPNRFPPLVEVIQASDVTNAAVVACAVVRRNRVGAHRSPVVPGSTPPTRCSM